MPNLVGIGNSQVPTNAMLGGLAYQDSVGEINIEKIKARTGDTAADIFVYDTRNPRFGHSKYASLHLHCITHRPCLRRLRTAVCYTAHVACALGAVCHRSDTVVAPVLHCCRGSCRSCCRLSSTPRAARRARCARRSSSASPFGSASARRTPTP